MMTYQLTDEDGMNITVFEDEKETSRMNETVWTRELDQQLFRDLEEYVLKTGDPGGVLLLCRKYHCTIGAIGKRIEEIHARSLSELDDHWSEFNAHRLTAHRLTGADEVRPSPGFTATNLSEIPPWDCP